MRDLNVKSLQLKIMLIFSALILLSGSVLGYHIYTSSVNLITQSIGEQARHIAEYAVSRIDLEQYEELNRETGANDYYHELRAELNSLRESNNLKYLYTMSREDNGNDMEYYYVVDGQPADAQGEDVAALGDVEEEPGDAVELVYAEQSAHVGELTEIDPYGALLTAYVPIVSESGEMLGLLGADFDASTIYDLLADNRKMLFWTSALILLVSVAVIYLFSRMIVSPMLRLTGAMHQVQEGNLTAQIEVKGKDEVGRLSGAFQSMVVVLKELIEEIQRSVREMRQSTQAHAMGAEETSAASNQMTRHLSDAASVADTLQQTTTETVRAIHEVGTGVQRIADSLSIVAEASQEATDAAKVGQGFVVQTKQQMESIGRSAQTMSRDIGQLAERSGEIREIVDLIKDIAGQTNLLALNAAIEAARAGEHGRGFAVVADQVRKLAVQSEQSAARISGLVDEMLTSTDKVVTSMAAETQEIEAGIRVVGQAGTSFEQIVAEVERVAGQLQEASAVSQQVAAGAEQVMASAEEMDRMTQHTSEHLQGIAQVSEEQTASIQEMSASTAELTNMSERLEQLIRRFKL